MAALPIGSTLGFLGGGQLARMAILAARQMGFGAAVLDPSPDCCAGPVADTLIVAPFGDVPAAQRLAACCAAVTYEIEQIDRSVLAAVAELTPLRPGPDVLQTIQDRGLQKNFLVEHGFAVGPYCLIDSAADLQAAQRRFGGAGRLKTRRGGYDGRGQVSVAGPAGRASGLLAAAAATSTSGDLFNSNPDGAPESACGESSGNLAGSSSESPWQTTTEALAHLGHRPCIFEAEIALKAELSVLVARRPSGETAVYPVARNLHTHGVLRQSLLPAPHADLPAGCLQQAQQVAGDLASLLQIEGLLAVEFFVSQDGELLVNELAPRPHNSYHASQMACATDQFTQLILAMADWPLGATTVVQPACMVNLFGERFGPEQPPDFTDELAGGRTQLHLYGKQPRPGRKMGHLLTPR
jgi:5-(carboxyamino)imidazole ribonucleotide synthase